MKQITLGTTGITVPQNAFGALQFSASIWIQPSLSCEEPTKAVCAFLTRRAPTATARKSWALHLKESENIFILQARPWRGNPEEDSENARSLPSSSENGLSRHLSVSLCRCVLPPRRRNRNVRMYAGSKRAGKDPSYRCDGS